MQVKLFQLGFGRKTIDGFNKELAVNQQANSCGRGRYVQDERRHYGVCLFRWMGGDPLNNIGVGYTPFRLWRSLERIISFPKDTSDSWHLNSPMPPLLS